MTKNPFINAVLASVYIMGLVLLLQNIVDRPNEGAGDDIILIPIVMLSLFTLSAAVMGYLFLSEPIQLFLDGKRKEAINFFLSTVLTFAGLTAVALVALLYLIS
jgi:hypothetical protein